MLLLSLNCWYTKQLNKKVNFIATETVKLPISFVIGVSFITGSITGSFLSLDLINKKL